jgi:hypothetical protein
VTIKELVLVVKDIVRLRNRVCVIGQRCPAGPSLANRHIRLIAINGAVWTKASVNLCRLNITKGLAVKGGIPLGYFDWKLLRPEPASRLITDAWILCKQVSKSEMATDTEAADEFSPSHMRGRIMRSER